MGSKMGSWLLSGPTFAIAILLFSTIVLSIPAPFPSIQNESFPVRNDGNGSSQLAKRAPDFYLRILPLGASIVWGLGSSTGNGFRKNLRDTLRQSQFNVNMVGSKNNGDMKDNEVEAHSGDHVAAIHEASKLSVKYKPNVILINAGNNDAREDDDIPNIGNRFNAMLDYLYGEVPGTTIILSTLIHSSNTRVSANIDQVNSIIRGVAWERRYGLGQKIVLADMLSPGTSFNKIGSADLLADGIHPNDGGYEKMASIWFQAIQEAETAGFLTPPVASEHVGDDAGGGSNTCDKIYGVSRGPVDTQQGSGLEDGIYKHNSANRGVRASIDSPYAENPFVFARISFDSQRHDILQLLEPDPEKGGRYYRRYPAIGSAEWDINNHQDLWLPDGCIKRGVRWADGTGNGLDDMFCISPNGDVFMTENYDMTKAPAGTLWRGLWKANEGYPQARVHLPDIDGDGRADYCVVENNGDLRCWRNGGTGSMPTWEPLGVLSKGRGFGDANAVRFFDINGDGRDDWMWMDDTGKTWTYTNNRGCDKGGEGQLTPLWRAGEGAAGPGPTHGGLGVPGVRSQIYFANVYNSPAHFGGLGRGDYVRIERADTVIPVLYRWNFNVWQNLGGGGAKLKGDGTRHCNMMGHTNGAEDLVWIHSTGSIRLYESRGGSFPPDPPYWGDNYIIWDQTVSGRDIDRRDIHLADWDGDGLCDIIWVDNDSPRMDVWINKYKQNRNFGSWDHKQNVGPGTKGMNVCPRRGKGLFDLGTRFADINGDGLADMLCLDKDGRVSGYINTNGGNTLTYHPQFKYSEGKERADLRFGDVNGDGRTDLMWIDKYTGDTTVWYNMGPIPASGSSFTWSNKGKLFQGALQGSCTMYPDLDGNGRVDMSAVRADTNSAVTWFNDCPGAGGGDDPNTHQTRAQIPAPAVDENIAAFLAARGWASDNWGIGEMADPSIKYQAERIEWHSSCNAQDSKSLKGYIYGAMQDSWRLIDEVAQEIEQRGRGDLRFTTQAAQEMFGPADKVESLYITNSFNMVYRKFAQVPTEPYTLRVRCDDWYSDPQTPKGTACGEDTKAYTVPADTNWFPGTSVESVTFCKNNFLPRNIILSFRDAITSARDKHRAPRDLEYYEHMGLVFYHELFHLASIGVNPIIGDLVMVAPNGVKFPAYGPVIVKSLAKYVSSSSGRTVSHRNADSYALYALALAVQYRVLNGVYPDEPPAASIPGAVGAEFNGRPIKRRRSDNHTTVPQPDPQPPIIFDGLFTLYPNDTIIMDPYYNDVPRSRARPGQESLVVELTYDSIATREHYTDDYLAALDERAAQRAGNRAASRRWASPLSI